MMAPAALSRGGMALLEVLVALAVLGIAATSVLALSAEVSVSARRALAAEARWRARERLLEALTRASAAELQAQVGRRKLGDEHVRVSSLGRSLYRIELVAADGAVLVGTVVLAASGRTGAR